MFCQAPEASRHVSGPPNRCNICGEICFQIRLLVPALVRIIRYLLLCMSESARSRILRPVWCVLVALVVVGSLLPANSPIMRTVDSLPVGDKFHHFTAYAA